MKTNMTLVSVAMISLLFFTSGNSLAFRCGDGLVGTGDTKTKVQMTCGLPTSKEKACKDTGLNANRTTKTKKKKCEKVEVWYYNCGEYDFVYALQFEDNILTDESTKGRGKGRSECNGK